VKLDSLKGKADFDPSKLSKTSIVGLQKELMAAGFDLPKYGADGDWGKETQGAFDKWIASGKKSSPDKGINLEERSNFNFVNPLAKSEFGSNIVDPSLLYTAAVQDKVIVADNSNLNANNLDKKLGSFQEIVDKAKEKEPLIKGTNNKGQTEYKTQAEIDRMIAENKKKEELESSSLSVDDVDLINELLRSDANMSKPSFSEFKKKETSSIQTSSDILNDANNIFSSEAGSIDSDGSDDSGEGSWEGNTYSEDNLNYTDMSKNRKETDNKGYKKKVPESGTFNNPLDDLKALDWKFPVYNYIKDKVSDYKDKRAEAKANKEEVSNQVVEVKEEVETPTNSQKSSDAIMKEYEELLNRYKKELDSASTTSKEYFKQPKYVVPKY
tara:strand:- start:3612 stop:4760 length:1149 start_codon:yes stop_codon:yes gene_type:complete